MSPLLWLVPQVLLVTCLSMCAADSTTELSQGTEIALQSQGDGDSIQRLIQQTPELVQLLSLLMIHSTSNVDVKMTPPHDGWKYVKQPDSFLASLTQINEDALQAVMNSSGRMVLIKGIIAQIPNAVLSVLNLLKLTDEKAKSEHLPHLVSDIDRIENEIIGEAQKAEESVKTVGFLIEEVGTAAAGEKENVFKQLAQENKQRDDEEAERKKQSDERARNVENNVNKVKQVFESLHHEYTAAVLEMPSENGTLRRSFLASGKTIFSYALVSSDGENGLDRKILNHLYAIQYRAVVTVLRQINVTAALENIKSPALDVSLSSVLTKAASKILADLKLPTEEAEKAKESFENVMSLMDKSRAIVNNTSQDNSVDSVITELNARIDSLKTYAVTEEAWSSALQDEAAKGISEELKAKANYVKLSMEAARLKVVKNRLLQEQVNVQVTIEGISILKPSNASATEVFNLLEQGIKILSSTQGSWFNLTSYISEVATRTVLAKKISSAFIDRVNEFQQNLHDDPLCIDLYKNALQSTLQTLNEDWLFTAKMVSTYVNVAEKFILPKLSAMPKYAAITTLEEREKALANIESEVNESKEEIDSVMVNRVDEMLQKLEAETAAALKAVEQIGAAVSEEERKQIEESLKMVHQFVK